MKYPANFGELSYNEGNKDKFLRTSKRFLTQVGKKLMELGVTTKMHVSVNPAGIAVGGDIYGYFNVGDTHGILVTITQSCVARNREDGVVCYIQQRAPGKREIRGMIYMDRIVGGNFNVNDITFYNVLEACKRVIETHPDSKNKAA